MMEVDVETEKEYEFQTEEEKLASIKRKAVYFCPKCGAHFANEYEALDCCNEDCYEQDKEFIEDRLAYPLRKE